MTFGLRTYTASGALILSDESAGGLFIAYVHHEDGSATSYSYPLLAGKTLRVLQVAVSKYTWSVSYASGFPVIAISNVTINAIYAFGAALELLVFAT